MPTFFSPMEAYRSFQPLLLAAVLTCLTPWRSHAADTENLTLGAKVTASSSRPGAGAERVVDGLVEDSSRWLATDADAKPSIEIRFPKPVNLAVVDVYSGWEQQAGLDAFDLSVEVDGKWLQPAEGKIRGNTSTAKRVALSAAKVTALRLQIPTKSAARIREIAAYEKSSVPITTGLKGEQITATPLSREIHQIALNQAGFEKGRSKRFTAPLSADGTPFIVRATSGNTPLFRSTIQKKVGDFSAFEPESSTTEYVIEVEGGTLKRNTSDPFRIGDHLYQEFFWQPAVDFLIDSRCVVGTHPSAYGGCPWRDGTYYDAILPALVLFQRADPGRVAAMPRQIDWQKDRQRVLSPAFRFDASNPGNEGVMDTVRKYYTELEPPTEDAPDVVKLIHWGAGYLLLNPATKDPSGDPDGRRIHSQTVEQIAYVVWAWPELKQWLPASFYTKCRDFCLQNWKSSMEIDKWWSPSTYLTVEAIVGNNPHAGLLHPYKGRHAAGHSIVPNLLMYEVAKRDQLDHPEQYLNAAIRQTQWIIQNLDWNDPRTTKGHRMSEHRTIPNLVWFLQHYPDKAPAGLREKIEAWAEVAAKRSDNLWDIRRFDDGANWTIPKLNDIGNWLSSPACTLAASWVVTDPKLKTRMREISVSHVDAVFGRNPRLAAGPQYFDGFTGLERPWPKKFPKNHCARLELCRGNISSGPGSEMFPFQPEAAYRHAEGWVNYGASWCISLAYFEFDRKQTHP